MPVIRELVYLANLGASVKKTYRTVTLRNFCGASAHSSSTNIAHISCANIIIIIIIMEKTEAGHQWPLYPRNTFGIITLNYIQLY